MAQVCALPSQIYTLCYEVMAPGRKSGFRLDFGRILIGSASKSDLRPAERRQEDQFWCFADWKPAEIQHGNQISGPEAL